jgi:ankyrin repeat protein
MLFLRGYSFLFFTDTQSADDEWTTMAYVGDTARLCQAIVDGDLEHVQDWCAQDGVDVNCRDYTGRTPLHLATMSSTLEIVQCLIDNGARLVARLVDGRTALHIAAARGEAGMVKVGGFYFASFLIKN